MEGETSVLEVSLMKFIFRISKNIKWKVNMELLEVSLMNFILRISKYIKWKVKVVLLQVSLMNYILWISKEIKKEGESDVTRSIIEDLHSSDIERGQMEGESGVT